MEGSPPSATTTASNRGKGAAFGIVLRDWIHRPYLPDEYAFEVNGSSWPGPGDTSSFNEKRYDFSVEYQVRKRFWIPFYGAGIGYAAGYEDKSEVDSGDEVIKYRKKSALLLHGFLGFKANALDFFHAGAILDFEPSGMYQAYEGYENFPLGGFTVRLTAGSYLF